MPLAKSIIDNLKNQGTNPDFNQINLINSLCEIKPHKIFFLKNKNLGLYIWGDVGRGKTFIVKSYLNQLKLHDYKSFHYIDFMNTVHNELNNFSGLSNPLRHVLKSLIKECSLIFIDEFQVEDIADAMILGRLFKILFEMGILIIATSNIHPRNLYSEGLNRDTFIPFIDKLEENMEIYNLQAEKDYRIDRIKNKRVYFSPIDGQNKKNFYEAWQNLIGSIEVTSRSIPLKGREIEVSVSAGKFANFSFEELCVKPLGVADYLAISNNYNIIFISDVPKLDSKKRNETKRFINLIDTFYENKKILFILAETHPKDILIGGKDANIFQRTVSRLEEMQSSDYLDSIISE